MAVSALVVTLHPDASADALRRLGEDGRFVVGEPGGLRVPVVLDTRSPEEDRRAYEWLLEQTGVVFVDVVAVYLETEAA